MCVYMYMYTLPESSVDAFVSAQCMFQQAIAADSFMGVPRTIIKGDVDAAMRASDHVVNGEFFMGGQEHFYLETHACVVRPTGEDGELEVFCSSQSPTSLQVRADTLYMYRCLFSVPTFHQCMCNTQCRCINNSASFRMRLRTLWEYPSIKFMRG